MRTFEQYVEKLRSMRPNVYMGGELVKRDDPRFGPGLKTIGMTFEYAKKPEYEALLTATSHLTGKKINRFCHIHQTTDDLLAKQEIVRLMCHKCGRCIQRCMGVDALNGVSVVTKDADLQYGTHYHENFLKFLYDFQENDLVACCAQTDIKGDRNLRPHQQNDPDMYLRVVEKRDDGIIVRGAKAHITIASYSDEIIAVPTRAMTPKDKDYAVSFAIPADTEGVKLVTVAHIQRARKHLRAPIEDSGNAHSMVIFEDVFVPWERVFLCGETDQAGRLAALFATFHRHSYTGCKPAYTDIIMGATALIAEYSGIAGVSHIRDKLSELITVAELVYASGIAAAVKAEKRASGTMVPSPLFCNVGRYHAGVNIYHEYETLGDIGGGLSATIPHEEDFFNPETADLLNKYIKRKEGVSAENIHRAYRLIENLIVSAPGAAAQISGLHGGGSPIMEKIAITSTYNLEAKKQIAKDLAGIKD